MKRRGVLITFGAIAILPIAALLGLHRSYSPGPVLAGHAPFVSQCSACHQPWRGVSNDGCIDCHGDYKTLNDHKSAKLSGKDNELLPGKVIPAFYDSEDKADKLSCRSCHTDHRGRHPDLTATAGSNCTFCHQHDAIDDVSAHTKKAIQRPTGSRTAIATSYAHARELELLQKRNPSMRHLPCESCHQLRKARADQPETFLLIRAGTALLDAPPGGSQNPAYSPQNPAAIASPTAAGSPASSGSTTNPAAFEQDDYSRLWASAPAAATEIPVFKAYKHVNALFTHSRAHLGYKCASCHEDIETRSKRPGDPAAREVAQCFNCHGRKPAARPAAIATSARAILLGPSPALADEPAAKPTEPLYKTCGQCHAFHVHGAKPDHDFPAKAPIARPRPSRGIRFAAYTIALGSAGGPSGGGEWFGVRRVIVQPWWLGILGLVLTGFGAGAYLRWIPSRLEMQKAAGSVAPQMTPEIPALDDGYQSSVDRLYIVGETAGTASINLAMRSGRQAIEFIGNRLKFEKPAAQPDTYDVAVIGCGPAGISAGTTAKSRGLSYLAIEKSTAASTIKNYPRGKFVQSTPLTIAEYGEFFMEDDTSKEGLIKKWEQMLAHTGLQILEREEVTRITARDGLFELTTSSRKTFKARFVVTAIGVRGSPRRLNVPGEAADRVFYNLVEPEEYKDKHILVAGGGNAGAEVAQALSNPDLRNTVAYSYRDVVLGPPVTPENAQKISALQQKGYLTAYPSTEVKELKPGKVVLAPRAPKSGGPKLTPAPGSVLITEPTAIDNDFVFAMLGAELPTKFLKSIGVRMTRKR
jgi:thioredoxin reductase